MTKATTEGGENNGQAATENNGSGQSTTSNGEGDWKTKYEAAERELTEMRMWKNKATDLSSKLTKVEDERDTFKTQVQDMKTSQAEADVKRAAEAKQTEILSKVSDKTRELVKDLGLELPDATDEDAVKAFETKVKKLDGTSTSTEENGTGESSSNNTQEAPPVGSNNNSNGQQPKLTPEQEDAALEERVAKVTF